MICDIWIMRPRTARRVLVEVDVDIEFVGPNANRIRSFLVDMEHATKGGSEGSCRSGF